MPERRGSACSACGREGPAWALRACPICGQTICTKCATYDYGRFFCSSRCGHYFFHGESDEEDTDSAEG